MAGSGSKPSTTNGGSIQAHHPDSAGWVYKRLLERLWVHRARLCLAAVALCLASAGALAVPWLARDVFQEAVLQQDLTGVQRTLLLVLIAAGIMSAGRFLAEDQIGLVALRMVKTLRVEMVGKLMRMPISFHAKNRTGESISRISSDVQMVQHFTYDALFSLGGDVIQVVGSIVLLFYLSWELTIVLVAIVPVGVILVGFTSKWVRRRLARVQSHQAEMTSLLAEQLVAMPSIQAFDAGAYEQSRFAKAAFTYTQEGRNANRIAAGSRSFVNFLGVVAIVVVLVYGLQNLDLDGNRPGALKLQDLVGFALYAALIADPLTRLTRTHFEIQRALAAGQRVFELIESNVEVADGTAALARPVRGEIHVESVAFRYRPDEPILDHLNLRIGAGETVAIVGASGSGKSTIAGLLLRFHRPDTGRVLFDGHDIANIRLADLRAHIGWVGQDPLLISGSVADNIRYGKRAATTDEIVAAARMVAADKFIRELPNQYEARIGERGVDLSGGQRARIAMARAVVRNPEIVIFDESTASLDTETEMQLWRAMKEWTSCRTTIIIAHRLLTILDLPRIVVLEHGAVVGDGTAEVLDRTCPTFRRLFAEQMNLVPKAA